MTSIKLYNDPLSGNGYKVRLMLSMLSVPYETVAIDLDAGQHRSEEFLKINPRGQVPVLTDENRVLPDSHAILAYLAFSYAKDGQRPRDPAAIAEIVQWLCYSANEIANGPASARGICLGFASGDLEAAQKRAKAALIHIDAKLKGKEWLVGNHWTIADIACFPYLESAGDGGVDLNAYPAICAWIERIKRLPGYVTRS